MKSVDGPNSNFAHDPYMYMYTCIVIHFRVFFKPLMYTIKMYMYFPVVVCTCMYSPSLFLLCVPRAQSHSREPLNCTGQHGGWAVEDV